MKSKDYEYRKPTDEGYEISEERKQQLIKKVKDQVKKGFIAHYQILSIGKNDEEYDYIYDWLDENDIEIRGINGTISGEIPNYIHYPKMGQSFTPEALDDIEQENLFEKLNSFSKKEQKDGVKEYQDTRNRLIEHNMKLANWVVNSRSITRIPIPLEDKKQMAYLGLIKAVDNFDPSMGIKFSTYAVKAIYRRILREVSREDGEIKQNAIISQQLEMIPEIENQMLMELNRKPEPYEIADILGVSMKRVHYLENLRNLREKESLQELKEIEDSEDSIRDRYYDEDKISNEEAGYVMDGVYIDEDENLPEGFRQKDITEDIAMTKSLKDTLLKVLSTLTERESEILKLRYGLIEGEEPKTQEVVGRIFGCTGSSIGRIEAKALRKMRHPVRSRKLKPYLDMDFEEYEH